VSRPLAVPPGSKQTPEQIRYGDFQRLLKIIPRLGSSNQAEAQQALMAATSALRAAGLDWNDAADALGRAGIGKHKPPARPKSWDAMSIGERFDWFRTLRDANWLTESERCRLADLSDKYCLVPEKNPAAEVCGFMDFLLRQSRER
jgi:hypothetical protein